MNKWFIEYVLKNGEHLFGTYRGPETDAASVAKVLLDGDLNTFNGCLNVKENGSLLVRNGDICAINISTTR